MFTWGDVVWDELDRTFHRFVRQDEDFVVLMDRNTEKELPDMRHVSQVRRPAEVLSALTVKPLSWPK
jgi:hypothetical protein